MVLYITNISYSNGDLGKTLMAICVKGVWVIALSRRAFFLYRKINNPADVAELGMNGIGDGLGNLSQIKSLGD